MKEKRCALANLGFCLLIGYLLLSSLIPPSTAPPPPPSTFRFCSFLRLPPSPSPFLHIVFYILLCFSFLTVFNRRWSFSLFRFKNHFDHMHFWLLDLLADLGFCSLLRSVLRLLFDLSSFVIVNSDPCLKITCACQLFQCV